MSAAPTPATTTTNNAYTGATSPTMTMLKRLEDATNIRRASTVPCSSTSEGFDDRGYTIHLPSLNFLMLLFLVVSVWILMNKIDIEVPRYLKWLYGKN